MSKSKAMQMCMQWQGAADLARQRALTEERAREVISEIVASVHGGEGLRTFTADNGLTISGESKPIRRTRKQPSDMRKSSANFWIL